MTSAPVCPAYAIAHCGVDFIAALTEAERFVLPYLFFEIWARPEQQFPTNDWRSIGFICGRGWGKTRDIAGYMNAEIEAGRIKAPGLMGPTEDRVDEIQIQALIDSAPPWFKPERYRESIRWPNGVVAEVHSAQAPDSSRSSNLDFTWLCEIVAWQASTRTKAFQNITTATRVGRAQFAWDTTSEGRNEIILALEAANVADPDSHPIIRGTTFDNPTFSKKYLRDECSKYEGQRLYEELFGEVFDGAAGALWSQTVINLHRRPCRPAKATLTIVAIDPALSAAPESDETGICVGDRGEDGHSYTFADLSGHHEVDGWAGIAVDWCQREAAGVVIERNHLGDNAAYAIISVARTKKMTCVKLKKDEPFPKRRPGTIYIREVVAASSKGARASGPSAEYVGGRGHIVGEEMKALESQMTMYVPGQGGASPNRYDAHAYLVTELAGLAHDSPGERAKEDARGMAEAAIVLQRELLAATRGRRVGM